MIGPVIGQPWQEFLNTSGVQVNGVVQCVKQRPWSLVLKVPTASHGLLYFKENRGETGYEAGLLQALAGWAPRRVVQPVAVDAARGWSLTRDAGPTLRDVQATPDPRRWEAMLAEHADFQRFLAVRVPDLIALGVPDQRPGLLPRLMEEQLAVPAAVAGYAPTLKRLCAELAGSPVPLTLQHDDLHDGNVFADGRVFDWGDSSVSHPFGVLLVTLRGAWARFDEPAVRRLRDAYLEPWTAVAPRARLLREVELAMQVAKVGRALAQRRALSGTPREGWGPWHDPVVWLEALLD